MKYNKQTLEFEIYRNEILENMNYLEVYGLDSDAVIIT